MFSENLVRGRGLFVRSLIRAQGASPTFTPVYAALVAVINTKLPEIGELLVKRLVLQFRRAYKRNDKTVCVTVSRFIAHLVNQQVSHEVLILEILNLLLRRPTDDSVEVAVALIKESGQWLTDVAPKALNAVFETFRSILHEATIDKRVQYMIEVLFQIRKDKFKDFVSKPEDLDLVEGDEQIMHLVPLDSEDLDTQEGLDVFKFDPMYEENEEKYAALKAEILGEDEEGAEGDASDAGEAAGEDEEDEDAAPTTASATGGAPMQIIDATNTNTIQLRKTIYLTIMSSVGFEECAHKLMKLNLKQGQEVELCNMIIDCCAQERTYNRYYGLLGHRFCQINRVWQETFQQCFIDHYNTVHRLDTSRLRNVAKFFAHLLQSDGMSWAVMSVIRLNEDDTTSSSRIFIKILLQDLSESLGIKSLNERLKDQFMIAHFEGLFPRDNPRSTRFAINFFTAIGLGALTYVACC